VLNNVENIEFTKTSTKQRMLFVFHCVLCSKFSSLR